MGKSTRQKQPQAEYEIPIGDEKEYEIPIEAEATPPPAQPDPVAPPPPAPAPGAVAAATPAPSTTSGLPDGYPAGDFNFSRKPATATNGTEKVASDKLVKSAASVLEGLKKNYGAGGLGDFSGYANAFTSPLLSGSSKNIANSTTNDVLIPSVKKAKNFATDEDAVKYVNEQASVKGYSQKYADDFKSFGVNDAKTFMNQPLPQLTAWYKRESDTIKQQIEQENSTIADNEYASKGKNYNPTADSIVRNSQQRLASLNEKQAKLDKIKDDYLPLKLANLPTPLEAGLEYSKTFTPDQFSAMAKKMGLDPATATSKDLANISPKQLVSKLPQSMLASIEENGAKIKIKGAANESIESGLRDRVSQKHIMLERTMQQIDAAMAKADPATAKQLMAGREQTLARYAADDDVVALAKADSSILAGTFDLANVAKKYPEVYAKQNMMETLKKGYDGGSWWERNIFNDTELPDKNYHGAIGVLPAFAKSLYGMGAETVKSLNLALGSMGMKDKSEAYLENVEIQNHYDNHFMNPIQSYEQSSIEIPGVFKKIAKDAGVKDEAFSEFGENPQYKFNWKSIPNIIGETTGQIVGQALLSELGGGLVSRGLSAGLKGAAYGVEAGAGAGYTGMAAREAATGMTKLAANIRKPEVATEWMGLFTSTYATTYAQNYDQAINAGLSDKEATQYSLLSSLGTALTEQMAAPTRQLKRALGLEATEAVNIRNSLNILNNENLSRAVRVKDFTKAFIKNTFHEVRNETAEEVVDVVKTALLDNAYGVNTTGLDFMDNVKQTAVSTAIGMLPMAIAGAFGGRSQFRRESLWEAGNKTQEYQEFLQDKVDKAAPDKKQAAQDEMNNVMKVANTMSQIIASLPHVNAKGRELSEEERMAMAEAVFKKRKLATDQANADPDIPITPEPGDDPAAVINGMVQGTAKFYSVGGVVMNREDFHNYVHSDQYAKDRGNNVPVVVENDEEVKHALEQRDATLDLDSELADTGGDPALPASPVVHQLPESSVTVGGNEVEIVPPAAPQPETEDEAETKSRHAALGKKVSTLRSVLSSLQQMDNPGAVAAVQSALDDNTEELKTLNNKLGLDENHVPGTEDTKAAAVAQADEDAAQTAAKPLIPVARVEGKPLRTDLSAAEQVESSKVGQEIKDRFDKAPKVVADVQVNVTLPTGEKMPGRFVLVPHNSITPSHNPNTFSDSKGFPMLEDGHNPNDRDYTKDENKAAVVSRANTYDGRALQDLPTVTPDGVVIDGNDRTMSGHIAARNKTDGEYDAELKKRLPLYGLTEEDYNYVAQAGRPRLVFVTDQVPAYTTDTFAKFNRQKIKSKDAVAKAIELSRTVEDRIIRMINSVIEPFDKLSDFYNNGNAAKQVKDILMDAGIISQDELAGFYDVKTNTFSAVGQEFLESLLIGRIVGEEELYLLNKPGMREYRQKIIKTITTLTNINAMGEDISLKDPISEAIRLKNTLLDKPEFLNTKSSAGNKWVDALNNYMSQGTLFGTIPDSNTVITFLHLEGTLANWVNFLNAYAKHAGTVEPDGGMFGEQAGDNSRAATIIKTAQKFDNDRKQIVSKASSVSEQQPAGGSGSDQSNSSDNAAQPGELQGQQGESIEENKTDGQQQDNPQNNSGQSAKPVTPASSVLQELAAAFKKRFGIDTEVISSDKAREMLSDKEKEYFFQILDDIDLFNNLDPAAAKAFIYQVFNTVSTPEEAKKAFRKLAVKYHPDKAGAAATEIMSYLNDTNDNYKAGTMWKVKDPSAQQSSASSSSSGSQGSNQQQQRNHQQNHQQWWDDYNRKQQQYKKQQEDEAERRRRAAETERQRKQREAEESRLRAEREEWERRENFRNRAEARRKEENARRQQQGDAERKEQADFEQGQKMRQSVWDTWVPSAGTRGQPGVKDQQMGEEFIAAAEKLSSEASERSDRQRNEAVERREKETEAAQEKREFTNEQAKAAFEAIPQQQRSAADFNKYRAALDTGVSEYRTEIDRIQKNWRDRLDQISAQRQKAFEESRRLRTQGYSMKNGFMFQLADDNIPAGFYDPGSGKAYVVDGKADDTTTIHEAFAHPLIQAAEKRNPELYDNLLREAKQDQQVVAAVDSKYVQGNRDVEYIAAAIDLAARKQLENKTLAQYVQEFWNEVKAAVKDIFGGRLASVENIEATTTIAELVDFVLKSGVDLNIDPTKAAAVQSATQEGQPVERAEAPTSPASPVEEGAVPPPLLPFGGKGMEAEESAFHSFVNGDKKSNFLKPFDQNEHDIFFRTYLKLTVLHNSGQDVSEHKKALRNAILVVARDRMLQNNVPENWGKLMVVLNGIDELYNSFNTSTPTDATINSQPVQNQTVQAEGDRQEHQPIAPGQSGESKEGQTVEQTDNSNSNSSSQPKRENVNSEEISRLYPTFFKHFRKYLAGRSTASDGSYIYHFADIPAETIRRLVMNYYHGGSYYEPGKKDVSTLPNTLAQLEGKIIIAKEGEALLATMETTPVRVANKQDALNAIRRSNFSAADKAFLTTVIESMPDVSIDLKLLASLTIPKSGTVGEYDYTTRLLTASNAVTLVHELSHFGFYEVLNGEQRVAYLEGLRDAYKDSGSSKIFVEWLADHVVIKEYADKMRSNGMQNFGEVFAQQATQHVFSNSDPKSTESALLHRVAMMQMQHLFNWIKDLYYRLRDKNLVIPEIREQLDAIFDSNVLQGKPAAAATQGQNTAQNATEAKPAPEPAAPAQPAAPAEPGQPGEYHYALRIRPFGIGTYPDQAEDGFVRYEENPQYPRFGTLVYSKPLSQERSDHFSLTPITEAQQYEGKNVFVLGDYGGEVVLNRNKEGGIEAVTVNVKLDDGDIDPTRMSVSSFLANVKSGRYRVEDKAAAEPAATEAAPAAPTAEPSAPAEPAPAAKPDIDANGKIIVDPSVDYSEGYPYLGNGSVTEFGVTKSPIEKIKWALWRRAMVQNTLDSRRDSDKKRYRGSPAKHTDEIKSLLASRQALDAYMVKLLPSGFDTKKMAWPTYTDAEKTRLVEDGILPKSAIAKMNLNTEPAAEPVSFKSGNKTLAGTRIEIPGYDLDFVAVRDGLMYSIHELASGLEVANISAMSEAEAVELTKKELDSKNFSAAALYAKLAANQRMAQYSNPSALPVNAELSPRYQKYVADEQAKEDAKPYRYSETERNDLRSAAERADQLGAKQAADTIRKQIDLKRNTPTDHKFGMDQVNQQIDYEVEKNRIDAKKAANEPLAEGEGGFKVDVSPERFKNQIIGEKRSFPMERFAELYDAFRKAGEVLSYFGYVPSGYEALTGDSYLTRLAIEHTKGNVTAATLANVASFVEAANRLHAELFGDEQDNMQNEKDKQDAKPEPEKKPVDIAQNEAERKAAEDALNSLFDFEKVGPVRSQSVTASEPAPVADETQRETTGQTEPSEEEQDKLLTAMFTLGLTAYNDILSYLQRKGGKALSYIPVIQRAYRRARTSPGFSNNIKNNLDNDDTIRTVNGRLGIHDESTPPGADGHTGETGSDFHGRSNNGGTDSGQNRKERPGIRYQGFVPTPTVQHVAESDYPIDIHQRLAVNLAIDTFDVKGTPGFMLADGPGVGKTRMLLALADYYQKKGQKILIVSLPGTIGSTFVKDAADMKIDLSKFEIGTYTALAAGKIGKAEYGLAIYDESHNLKNSSSKKALMSADVESKNTVFVSATPMDMPMHASYFLHKVLGLTEHELNDRLGLRVEWTKNRKGGMRPTTVLQTNFDTFIERLNDARLEAQENGAMIRREYPFFGTVKAATIPSNPILDAQIAKVKTIHDNRIDNIETIGIGQLAGEMSRRGEGEFFDLYKKLSNEYKMRSGSNYQSIVWKIREALGKEKKDYLSNMDKYNEIQKADYILQGIIKAIGEGKSVAVAVAAVNPQTVKAGAKEGDKYGFHTEKVPSLVEHLNTELKRMGISQAAIYGSDDTKKTKYKKNMDAFQSGQAKVLLFTARSGGTGIDLDDQVGDRPRKVFFATLEYGGDTLDQLLGRFSRRNTKSEVDIEIVRFDNASDNNRLVKSQQKSRVMDTMTGGVGNAAGMRDSYSEDEFEDSDDDGQEEKIGPVSLQDQFTALNKQYKAADRKQAEAVKSKNEVLHDQLSRQMEDIQTQMSALATQMEQEESRPANVPDEINKEQVFEEQQQMAEDFANAKARFGEEFVEEFDDNLEEELKDLHMPVDQGNPFQRSSQMPKGNFIAGMDWGRMNRMTRDFADFMERAKQVLNRIAARGVTIDQANDFYNLFYLQQNKTSARITQVDHYLGATQNPHPTSFVRRFQKDFREWLEGKGQYFKANQFDPFHLDANGNKVAMKTEDLLDKFGLYLYAKHAQERNDYVAMKRGEVANKEIDKIVKQNALLDPAKDAAQIKANRDYIADILADRVPHIPLMADGGSGMTNRQAQEIKDAAFASGLTDMFEDYGAEYRNNIVLPNLEAKFKYSLISADDYDTLLHYYKNYVPLRKDLGEEFANTSYSQFSTMLGKDLFKTKGATGLTWKERINPVVQAAQNYKNTIVLGEGNIVNRAVGQMVLDFPDDSWYVLSGPDPDEAKRKDKDKQFAARYFFNGDPYYIYIKDPELRKALTRSQMLTLAKVPILQKIIRYKSKIATTFTIGFQINNALSDFFTSQVNLSVEKRGVIRDKARKYAIGGPGVLGSMRSLLKGDVNEALARMKPTEFLGAGRAMWGYNRNPGGANTAWGDWAKKFVLAGGMMNYDDNTRLEMTKSSIESAFGSEEDEANSLQKAADWWESLSGSVENGIRLATFRALVEEGYSDYEAAVVSKNATTDFSKKGNYSAWMNAAFLFFNPAVQGMASQVKRWRQNPARAAWAAGITFTAGLAISALNEMFSDCTDKKSPDCYDNLQEWEKENYVILPGPNGFWKFKMPRFWQFFYSQGVSLKDYMSGRKNGSDLMRGFVNSAYETVSPISTPAGVFSDKWDANWQMLFPSLLQPFIGAYANRDVFGRPITKEQPDFAPNDPDSQTASRNASSYSKAIAEGLNTATGGNEVESGKIDVSPDSIEYWLNNGFGGFYKTFDQVYNVAESGVKTGFSSLETRDIPIVSNLYTKARPYVNMGRIYTLLARSGHEKLSPEEMSEFKTLLRAAAHVEEGSGKPYLKFSEIKRMHKTLLQAQAKIKRYRNKKD